MSKEIKLLTLERLKYLLSYNKEMGVFVRNIGRGKHEAFGVSGVTRVDGYLTIRIDGKGYLAHRLAWLYEYGEFPEKSLDHINGIKHDNRIVNLRLATYNQNQFNRGKVKNNTLGIKGVQLNKYGKFIAKSKLNGKTKYLGSFLTIKEASEAYQIFAKQNHGEFYHG